MLRAILEIHSDSHGNPGGPDWHYVVISDRAMPAVNQMHDGGRLPDNDCAVACTMSILDASGIANSGLTVETQEGTTTAGTYLPAIVATFAKYGVPATTVNSTPPGPWWVMNPAWGGVITPAQSGPYLRATTNWCVLTSAPASPVSTTTPTGGTAESQGDPRMYSTFWHAGRVYLSDGMHFRLIPTFAALADVVAVITEATGKPPVAHNTATDPSVADLSAFGVPANADTAAAAQATFP